MNSFAKLKYEVLTVRLRLIRVIDAIRGQTSFTTARNGKRTKSPARQSGIRSRRGNAVVTVHGPGCSFNTKQI